VADRLRIDLFAFALGALALISLAFLETRNGAALVMCVLCFAGLLAARLAGFSNRALVPVTLGLVVILWLVWFDPITITSRNMSALAHAGGGALIGWALSEFLRTRIGWPQWGVIALLAVFAVTLLWEVGEFAGDRILTTSLQASKTDSVLDVFFGTFGGAATVALAWLLAPRPTPR
jgi:hypothetical protein